MLKISLSGLILFLLSNCNPIYNKAKLTLIKEPFAKENVTFRTDGYYFHIKSTSAPLTDWKDGDTLSKSGIVPLFFFDDGYVYFSDVVYGLRNHRNEIDKIDSLRKSIAEYEKNLIRWSMVIENRNKKINGWGRYKQYGNELLIQKYINRGGKYILVEFSGKVINEKTIAFTSKHYPGHPMVMDEKHERTYELFEFKPLKIKPDSSNYIRSHLYKFDRKAILEDRVY